MDQGKNEKMNDSCSNIEAQRWKELTLVEGIKVPVS